jgi:ATP-dependent Zn protease
MINRSISDSDKASRDKTDQGRPDRDKSERGGLDRSKLIPKGPRLDELHGLGPAKAWGQGLARDLIDYVAGKIAWSDVDPGALIHGMPGTGKNLFAQALAATCGLPLISTSYAQWQRSGSGHLGDVLAAMHESFELAKQYAPSILFIDEFEAVGSRAIGGHNQTWYTGVITAANVEINDVLAHEGVVVIAAANFADRIDAALKRPGRLDTEIAIPMPSAEDLAGIIRFHLKDDLRNADLRDLAQATVGMTGAHVERMIRLARRRARDFKRRLRREDLFAVLGEGVSELEPEYLRRIAIHEAGHATAAVVLRVSSNVNVTIFHFGREGAATFFDPRAEALTRKVVERRISVALAGRAAEEVLLGCVTAGAGGLEESDLAVATRIGYSAVAQWGLSSSPSIGWLRKCAPEQIMVSHPRLAEEAQRMIDAAYVRARALIKRRRRQVEAIADALVKRRALAHADIEALLARSPGPAKSKAAPARKRVRKRA